MPQDLRACVLLWVGLALFLVGLVLVSYTRALSRVGREPAWGTWLVATRRGWLNVPLGYLAGLALGLIGYFLMYQGARQ
jgi:hypothetical protein